MKYLYLSLSLFLLTSCTKKLEVRQANGLHYVKDISSEIERVKEVPWKIGRDREVTISQGLRFFTTVPQLSEEAQEILTGKYGIDSWVFRFTRVRRGKPFPMRYFFLKFKNITRNTKNISVSLFYQAAAVSKKFRFFHCPAFGHRLTVTDFDLIDRRSAKTGDLYVRSIERLRAKAVRFKFSPMVLPAGRSILGDYFVDLAFYDSNSRQIFSRWHAIDGVIRVQQEDPKIVASCAGIKEELEPLPESRVPDIRDFEIK